MSARPPVAVRALLLVCVLLGLGGLCVWHGTLGVDPAANRFPSGEDLAHDDDRYVGDRATIVAPVVATDPLVVADHGTTFTITGLDADPARGDWVAASGVVEPDRELRASRGYVVPVWRRWYTWLVSALAGVWVLARIGRQWTVDRTDWTLRPREGHDA